MTAADIQQALETTRTFTERQNLFRELWRIEQAKAQPTESRTTPTSRARPEDR